MGRPAHVTVLRERADLASSFSRMGVIADAFADFSINADDWFRVLGEHWSTCDDIAPNTPTLRYVLSLVPRRCLHLAMNSDELAEWERLPRMLTVYRGCYTGRNVTGLSWSLSRDTAARFPFLSRYRQPDGVPILITGRVNKELVIYKGARGEQEIIAPRVRVVAREMLGEADDLRAA
jgi:hypothetical protein